MYEYLPLQKVFQIIISGQSGKDTRIRTVCSVNQVRQFIEESHHTNGVLKANCLFPQNFCGSPCVTKQSGFVIGVGRDT